MVIQCSQIRSLAVSFASCVNAKRTPGRRRRLDFRALFPVSGTGLVTGP